MADTTTPNYGFIQPEIGASRDTWGAKWNQNLGLIDTILGASTPIGMLVDFAGLNAPIGWLLADGTLYSVVLYSKLFAVIGNRYGGDGVTTFAVPDTRARVLAGVGTTTDAGGVIAGFVLGQKTGFFEQTLDQTHMPNYQLPQLDDGSHVHTGQVDMGGYHAHGAYSDYTGDHVHSAPWTNQGGPTPAFTVGVNQGAGYTDSAGGHYHNVIVENDGYHYHTLTVGGGSHYHSFFLGGLGQPVLTMQPSLGMTKIIYCGPPGGTTVRSLPPAQFMPAAFLAAPMRGMH